MELEPTTYSWELLTGSMANQDRELLPCRRLLKSESSVMDMSRLDSKIRYNETVKKEEKFREVGRSDRHCHRKVQLKVAFE